MNKTYLTIALIMLSMIAYGQKPLKIVSSASIFQDMAKNIGGDKIETFSIVPIGGDPHTYTPKPSDVRLVASADLILVNGLTFEGWIKELIENSGTKAESILITEGVSAITSQKYKNASDPHAWMNASNGITYAKNIAKGLAALDPDNASFYNSNVEKYMKSLQEMDQYIKAEVAKIPDSQRVLITSHDAFQYYGRAYGIELSAIMGISTESEAQSKDVQRVIDQIRDSKVPAVFIESTINPKTLQQIAKDTGVKIGGELFSDSIGDEGSDAPTYLMMLKHNTDVIVNALTSTSFSATKIDTDDSGSKWYVYLGLAAVMLLSLVLIVIKMNK